MTIGPTFVLNPSVVIDAGAVINVWGLGANAVYVGLTWNVGRLPFRTGGQRPLAYFRPIIPFLRASLAGF